MTDVNGLMVVQSDDENSMSPIVVVEVNFSVLEAAGKRQKRR